MEFTFHEAATAKLGIDVYTCTVHPPGQFSVTWQPEAFGPVERTTDGPALIGTPADIDALPDLEVNTAVPLPLDENADAMLSRLKVAEVVATMEKLGAKPSR